MRVIFRVTRLRCSSCDGKGCDAIGGICFVCLGVGKLEARTARLVAVNRSKLPAMLDEAGLHHAAQVHRERVHAVLSIPTSLYVDFPAQVPA